MGFVDKKNKLGFVHIYKTGGMSIREALIQLSQGDYLNIGGHITLEELNKAMAENGIDEAQVKTFAIVRNPYQWLISVYQFSKSTSLHPLFHFALHRTADEFISWLIDNEADINKWGILNGNLSSQTHNLLKDGKIAVDYVLRFENIEEEFMNMVSELNIPLPANFKFPHENKNASKSELYLSLETISKINERYMEDFKNFGYSVVI